jgi:hypothetical protein
MAGPGAGFDRFLHTGRELDIQVFNREFAGDQAGEEEVAPFEVAPSIWTT